MTEHPSQRRGTLDIRALLEPLPPALPARPAPRDPPEVASSPESRRIAHELASHLTVILGQTELARTAESPEAQAEALLELERAAERARGLCERLQGRGAAAGAAPRSDLPGSVPATILVVDDDSPVRAAARRILEAVGHRVVEACDGDEALAIQAREEGLDLVLLDLTMPHRGGPETLAALRRLAPRLPVLVTSGHDPEEVARLVPPWAARGYLPKPFTPEGLRAAVLRSLCTVPSPRST